MPAKQRKKGWRHLANVARLRRVAIIAVPPARLLDVVGPAEVFTDANIASSRGGAPSERNVCLCLIGPDRAARALRQGRGGRPFVGELGSRRRNPASCRPAISRTRPRTRTRAGRLAAGRAGIDSLAFSRSPVSAFFRWRLPGAPEPTYSARSQQSSWAGS